MNEIRIGVIGVGQIGKMHLKNYSEMDNAKVIAIADVNRAELEQVGEKFNVSAKVTDFRELLKRDDLDAVDVCLHNNLHAPVAIAALKSGKHVYCEKPIAGSYADGKAMLDAAKEYGKKLHIQLFTLFDKETRAAKELIDNGKLGKIYHARCTGFRRRGRPYVDGYGTANFVKKDIAAGGALFDMGVYHIAQILYLIGTPQIRRICGKIYQETEIDPERKNISGYDVEELGLGFVNFENNISLDIIESWAIHLNSFEGSSIVGSAGGLRLAPLSFHSNVCDLEMDATFNLDQMAFRWGNLRESQDAYESSQKHWIAALQERVPLMPTAGIALQMMLIAEGIYLSHQLDREVSVDEVVNQSKSCCIHG